MWTQTPTCLGGTITWDASLFPVLWEVWTFSYPCHRRFKLLKSLQPLTGKYISCDIWCSKTDSRSSVPRDAATPPSWSQHCSSKAGVSFQDLLGCGTWRMQSVCSNFNFVWFLSSCWKSEYGPDSFKVAVVWGKELLPIYVLLFFFVTPSCLNLFPTSVTKLV